MIMTKNSKFEEIFEYGLNPFMKKYFACKFCNKPFKTRQNRYKHEITCIKSVISVSIPQTFCLMEKDPKNSKDIPIKLNCLKLFSKKKNQTTVILKDDFYELSSKKKI